MIFISILRYSRKIFKTTNNTEEISKINDKSKNSMNKYRIHGNLEQSSKLLNCHEQVLLKKNYQRSSENQHF